MTPTKVLQAIVNWPSPLTNELHRKNHAREATPRRARRRAQAFMPRRLQSIETLALTDETKDYLFGSGLKTIEDVLRWRGTAPAATKPLPELDRALGAAGLFLAEPMPEREWQMYQARLEGATFANLAKECQITPEAVRFAFNKIQRIVEAESEVSRLPDKNGLKVQDLPLPTRAKFALQRARIFSLGDLLRTTETDLLRIKGVGQGSLRAIQEVQQHFRTI